MSEQHTCPKCGKTTSEGDAQGLCPACLMKAAMASETFATRTNEANSTPPPTPEEIADKFPQYEVVECLGRGGMGVVYKARQKSLDRWVAIKVLAPERVNDERFAGHFEREAKTLAKMSHPNIVTVFDHGETDGLYYIVMEYIDGVNLRDLLREGNMEPEQALAIVPPICEALEYAHEKGVVHRDIKPENLLLDRDGRIKIADFGIASLVGATGVKSGTPPYMAPEQSSGTVDRRADIYALGAVLYEMLTGERLNQDLVAPSKRVQVDVKIDEMVMRALEEEPERRYQTAEEFRTVVETINSTSREPVHRAYGFEHRSKTKWFGLPLLHVATGMDPKTGKKRVARGIIAIGDVAQGVLAIGGVAMGGVAIGGLSLGLVSLGGMAVALLLAFGGGSIGTVAVGGGAMGWWVFAGGGLGVHVMDGLRNDPEAMEFFLPWGEALKGNIQWLASVVLIFALVAVPVIVMASKTASLRKRQPKVQRFATSEKKQWVLALYFMVVLMGAIAGPRLLSDYMTRRAGPAINTELAERSLTPELQQEYSLRWEEMRFEPNTISPSEVIVRFDGLVRMRRLDGRTTATPLDGFLNLKALDGIQWRADGLQDLAGIQFYFNLGDTGEPEVERVLEVSSTAKPEAGVQASGGEESSWSMFKWSPSMVITLVVALVGLVILGVCLLIFVLLTQRAKEGADALSWVALGLMVLAVLAVPVLMGFGMRMMVVFIPLVIALCSLGFAFASWKTKMARVVVGLWVLLLIGGGIFSVAYPVLIVKPRETAELRAQRAEMEAVRSESHQMAEEFEGVYQMEKNGQTIRWHIVKRGGEYHLLESDNDSVAEHNQLELRNDYLLTEDPAERFRFSLTEGGLRFEMWRKSTGDKVYDLVLERVKQAKGNATDALYDGEWVNFTLRDLDDGYEANVLNLSNGETMMVEEPYFESQDAELIMGVNMVDGHTKLYIPRAEYFHFIRSSPEIDARELTRRLMMAPVFLIDNEGRSYSVSKGIFTISFEYIEPNTYFGYLIEPTNGDQLAGHLHIEEVDKERKIIKGRIRRLSREQVDKIANWESQLEEDDKLEVAVAITGRFLEFYCKKTDTFSAEKMSEVLKIDAFIKEYGSGDEVFREHHDQLPELMRLVISEQSGELKPEYLRWLRSRHASAEGDAKVRLSAFMEMLGIQASNTGTENSGASEDADTTDPHAEAEELESTASFTVEHPNGEIHYGRVDAEGVEWLRSVLDGEPDHVVSAQTYGNYEPQITLEFDGRRYGVHSDKIVRIGSDQLSMWLQAGADDTLLGMSHVEKMRDAVVSVEPRESLVGKFINIAVKAASIGGCLLMGLLTFFVHRWTNREGELERTALFLCIAGVILPCLIFVCLALPKMFGVMVSGHQFGLDTRALFMIAFVLFVAMQLAALICGVMRFSEAQGRAATIASGIMLLLAGLFL